MSGPGTLEGIARTLDDVWSEHPEVPAGVRMRMAIAAGEIGANIVEHAGAGGPVRLRMQVELSAHEVRISFTDDGSPAEVDLTALPAPDPMAERGRGLRLARAVVSELTYRRNSVANHWLLVSERFA